MAELRQDSQPAQEAARAAAALQAELASAHAAQEVGVIRGQYAVTPACAVSMAASVHMQLQHCMPIAATQSAVIFPTVAYMSGNQLSTLWPLRHSWPSQAQAAYGSLICKSATLL